MPPTLAAFSFLTLHIFSDYADYKQACRSECPVVTVGAEFGNDSNLLIVFYVQIMPDDFVMQLHR
ncbi:hypothetical protein SBS96_17950, partial [Klebsiella pneumoniae]